MVKLRRRSERSALARLAALRFSIFAGTLLITLVLPAVFRTSRSDVAGPQTRHLLADGIANPVNTTHAECEITDKIFGASNRGGAAFGFFLFTLWTFLGLAIICDDYFVDSLELISDRLSLSPDVAGATFMAAGSSAPELFTSVADSFFTKKQIGTGTIVGSAVFNLVVIPGLSAVAAGKTLDLDWRPLARDSSFYATSIIMLTLFLVTDARIDWWEALILLLTYASYIAYMKFNEQITNRFCPRPYDNQLDEAAGERRSSNQARRLSIQDSIHRLSGSSVELEVRGEAADAEAAAADLEHGDDEEEESKWAVPSGPKAILLWALSMPYTILFTLTVPDLKVEKWKSWYPVTFATSVAWIGLLTWLMSELAVDIGCVLEIDPVLLGIVLLAAGTSVPDTIASMIVAKEGEGDMAVSNAIGSNVFDILLGLGFPWLLSILIDGAPIQGAKDDDGNSEANGTIVLAAIQLLIILAFTLGLLKHQKFALSPRVGYVLFALYFVYVGLNTILYLAGVH